MNNSIQSLGPAAVRAAPARAAGPRPPEEAEAPGARVLPLGQQGLRDYGALRYSGTNSVPALSVRRVHCVDLGESFRTHIYLQNLASIPPASQPRTSLAKFARSPRTVRIIIIIIIIITDPPGRSRRTASNCLFFSEYSRGYLKVTNNFFIFFLSQHPDSPPDPM